VHLLVCNDRYFRNLSFLQVLSGYFSFSLSFFCERSQFLIVRVILQKTGEVLVSYTLFERLNHTQIFIKILTETLHEFKSFSVQCV
jgi:hypothetical protein